MVELRDAGCVAFSDDGRPVQDPQLMRRALEYSSMLGAVLACHEEEESLSCGFAMHEGSVSLRLGLKGMPAAAENVMISRDIELVHLTGAPAHFCHVSSARGALLIRRAKEDGLPVTAEVTPHHLTFTHDDIGEYNTNMKMNPPLRTEEDRIALLQALQDGVIDCIASDHAPHEFDSKNCEFSAASNGILGLQTNLPVTLTHVAAGRLTLKRAIEAWTSAPARCLNITPNRFKNGAAADITVIDLKQKIAITSEMLCSKSKNTPWLESEYTGCAVKTFVGGRKVYEFIG
jgi:dihydroorotase